MSVYVMLIDLNSFRMGFRPPTLVWRGSITELSNRNTILKLLDALTVADVMTDEEWCGIKELWADGEGETLFGVSTNQTKEEFCVAVEEKYSAAAHNLFHEINRTQTYNLVKLVVGRDC